MDELKLVFPTPEMENAVMDYRTEFFDNGEIRIHGSGGLHNDSDYRIYLDKITHKLIKSGFDVTALDLSAPVIEVTRNKLKEGNYQANLIVSNMTDFKLDRKFSLAIIARSGFMHLLSAEEQRQALCNIYNHLTDDGILTLNTFQPHPKIQSNQMNTSPDDFTLRSEYINKDGHRERIYNAITYNYQTQIMSGNWKFETLDDNGNIIDTRIRPLAMRQTYKQEIEYLFKLCNFDIVNVYNDYRKSPYNGNCIWILNKRG
ncbi:MAG: methyltransferase domain-containing protein [Oscillospiraceae bacterium]|nr:methyltransferase domain-containing protein [Oscillospiraceae bacterium]